MRARSHRALAGRGRSGGCSRPGSRARDGRAPALPSRPRHARGSSVRIASRMLVPSASANAVPSIAVPASSTTEGPARRDAPPRARPGAASGATRNEAHRVPAGIAFAFWRNCRRLPCTVVRREVVVGRVPPRVSVTVRTRTRIYSVVSRRMGDARDVLGGRERRASSEAPRRPPCSAPRSARLCPAPSAHSERRA